MNVGLSAPRPDQDGNLEIVHQVSPIRKDLTSQGVSGCPNGWKRVCISTARSAALLFWSDGCLQFVNHAQNKMAYDDDDDIQSQQSRRSRQKVREWKVEERQDDNGRSWDRRRVQDISYDDMKAVRNQEMGMVLRHAPEDMPIDRSRYYEERQDPFVFRQRVRRERYPEDVDNRRRSMAVDRPRRRDPSPSSSESDSRSRHRRHRHRRHRSQERSKKEQQDDESSDGGKLWYSGRPRKDCGFFEKHFDSSYDGLISAAAGAAIGAMTARHFRENIPHAADKKRTALWGGALVGAATFNMAENHFRVYTEERERKGKGEMGVAEPLELAGEGLQVI